MWLVEQAQVAEAAPLQEGVFAATLSPTPPAAHSRRKPKGSPRQFTPSKSGRAGGSSLDSAGYQTEMMTDDSAFRTAVPGRMHTLASLRFFQIETLKDALQEQFAAATQSELERCGLSPCIPNGTSGH